MPAHDILAAESASLELSGTHSCQLFRAPDPNAKMCPLFLAGFSGGNNPPLRSATVRACGCVFKMAGSDWVGEKKNREIFSPLTNQSPPFSGRLFTFPPAHPPHKAGENSHRKVSPPY